MPKIVILKNQTAADIDFTTIGETLPASGQIDLSDYTAKSLRNDSTLTSGVDTGDIVVNDGVKDLDIQIGAEYIRNDTVSDTDGFWYAKRRRFSVLWNQTAHGFVEGQIIRLDEDTGLATLALADSHANSATTSIVAEVVDADSFYAGLSGAIVENVNALSVEGGLPMVVGSAYFLSTTVPGQITPNPPQGIGEIVKLVGVAVKTDALTSFAYAGYENETGTTAAEVTKMKSGGSIVRHPNTFQRAVLSMAVNDPSTLTPSGGDRYVVGTSPVGVWSGMANSIVEYVASTSTWYEIVPEKGYITFDNQTLQVFYFDGSVWVNTTSSSVAADLASVTVGFATTFALPLTMTDIVWDVTHLQNDTSIVEHDSVNQERILIKETGLYFINYSMSFDADPGEEQISSQVVRNGPTVVPASFRLASEDDEINDLSNAFTAELAAGDYITMQSMANGTGNTCHNSTNFCVTRARGTKGDKGDPGTPGSGSTVSILDDGVAVANTPHSSLNFVGMEATDAGSGQADIKNVFGSEFQKAESPGFSTTTSTTFQNKLTMTTTSLPAGTYRVGIRYGWNHNSPSNDFEGRIKEDAVQLGELHKQEPKDSGGSDPTGTTQRYYLDRAFYRTLTAGVHTFDIEFRTDTGGTTSSIWEATIELWRVS